MCEDYKVYNKKRESNDSLFCDCGRIRTCDRLLRRQMLYPAELRNLLLSFVLCE